MAAPSQHLGLIPLILIALAALAAYSVLTLISPTHRCPRCHGKRVIVKGKRVRRCHRCRATGRVRRLGATAVHRLYWSALGDHLMERRRASQREED